MRNSQNLRTSSFTTSLIKSYRSFAKWLRKINPLTVSWRKFSVALLLTKSIEIHISYVTRAMIEHFSVIEERHPNFACRILFVAAGRTGDCTLSDFLKDFQSLGLMLPNVHSLPIDFKYVVKTPDHHVPDVSNNSSFATERKVLVIMLLSVIAFRGLNTPSGVYRVSYLELIAAPRGSLETHCLRIISNLTFPRTFISLKRR
jgi:hypothetical protein